MRVRRSRVSIVSVFSYTLLVVFARDLHLVVSAEERSLGITEAIVFLNLK